MNLILNIRVLLVLAIPLLVIVYLFANKPQIGSVDAMEGNQNINKDMWKNLDLLSQSLPENTIEIMKKVQIQQKEENIGGAVTYIQTAEPPPDVKSTEKVVLLLHGAAFTSQTWVDKVPTIATLAALGNKVIAIDLPGFGNTKVFDKDATNDKGAYLSEVINILTPNIKPIVVTPSMSGSFIIPLLEASPEKVSGWVPVAPVDTDKGKGFFSQLEIPTMIVYGELDASLGVRSRDHLIHIKSSTKPQVLPGAKHPAYLDQPDLWHQLLFNFIAALPA